ncbi:MAG: DotA/TraY family protein, partial [Gammaproteobacteria bacterium]
MKKWLLLILTMLAVPQWAFAADEGWRIPLGFFTPGPEDVSVYLLGKIFGVVGGVLTGDALVLGEIFRTFNLAVLAIGGIVLIYIIFVSTLNTCNEGELLGRKWSSIFIPLRAVGGVALLLPLGTTGYCAIQVFVMWVTLQGVGLADRVWETTIDFIARGGEVLATDLNRDSDADEELEEMSKSAGGMLQGAACMQMLESFIKFAQQSNCSPTSTQSYCQPVPNFAASVDITGEGQKALNSIVSGENKATARVDFPDFSSDYDSAFSGLNGVCGSMSWTVEDDSKIKAVYEKKGLVDLNGSSEVESSSYISQALISQAAFARTVAMQQMYLDMSNAGQRAYTNWRSGLQNSTKPSELSLGKVENKKWVPSKEICYD